MHRIRNQFRLFALGDDFDVDKYKENATLIFDDTWHRGDFRRGSLSEYSTSGVAKYLGDGRELSIYDQDSIAANFLEQHQGELADLARYSGVTTFVLGLHFRVELTLGMLGFCMSPSPRLMRLALAIGVEPTFYVDLDWDELVSYLEDS